MLGTSIAGGRARPEVLPRRSDLARSGNAGRIRGQAAAISDKFDFLENSYLGAGDKTDKRALNVNSVDEVPDSSWYTNRIGRRAMTDDEIVRGPDTGSGPHQALDDHRRQNRGHQPGFTIRDGAGQVYFIKFDPPSNPEMASGAEVIATKFLYAFGYNVPENYLATYGATLW